MVKLTDISLKIWVLGIMTLLLPVVFLPQFLNPFTTGKLTVFFVSIAMSILLAALSMRPKTVEKISLNKKAVGAFLFIIFIILYNLITGANNPASYFDPGISLAYILSAITFVFAMNAVKEDKGFISCSLYLSGFLTALIILFARLGIFSKFSFLPDFAKEITFTPIGSPLQTIVFLIILSPLAINFLREKVTKLKLFGAISLLVILGGVVFQIDPAKEEFSNLLEFSDSWKITLETMVEKSTGFGSGNHYNAFDLFKSPSLNVSENWNVRYGSGRNSYLTLMTEFGIFGLLISFFLIKGILSSLYMSHQIRLEEKSVGWEGKTKPETLSLLILFLISFFLPFGLLLSFLSLLLLGLSLESKRSDEVVFYGRDSMKAVQNLTLSTKAFLFILPFVLTYFFSKNLLAEYGFAKAVDLLYQNKGSEAYDLIKEKVIPLSPGTVKYRSFYAQTNLAIAQSLSKNPEENKDIIPQLIQQAIREAKVATEIDSKNAQNWLLLGNVYSSIAAFTSDASEFAIQAYNQAAILDPYNPSIRMSLGGTYTAMGEHEKAKDAFSLAVLLKPDSANAHFNLAGSYKELDEPEKAIDELNIVLTLLDPTSDPYKKVQEDLELLQDSI